MPHFLLKKSPFLHALWGGWNWANPFHAAYVSRLRNRMNDCLSFVNRGSFFHPFMSERQYNSNRVWKLGVGHPYLLLLDPPVKFDISWWNSLTRLFSWEGRKFVVWWNTRRKKTSHEPSSHLGSGEQIKRKKCYNLISIGIGWAR